MGGKGNGKFLKLKFSFHRNSPSRSSTPPPEYICPICNSLFSDPVVVGSGHTVDRLCAEVCETHNYKPEFPDKTRPDFSTKIPNLALRSAIPAWCSKNGVALPQENDKVAIEKIVKEMIEKEERENDLIRPSERFLIESVKDKADPDASHAVTELTHRVNRFDSSTSSEESVIAAASPLTPLPFTTRPASCWSPFHTSSSETLVSDDAMNPNPSFDISDDEEFIAKFKSCDPYEQEQGAISLRKATRNDEEARKSACTPRLLLALGSLLFSSYEKVQINAIAALVNLSLEKTNKVKIVRSGIAPTVIQLLRGRLSEAQEHAAGLIFSLSLEEKNRTAIGVLGALPPLLNCLLRSESERTRSDAALALYNLSLDHSNRVKLVKQFNAVPPLLAVLRQEKESIAGRVLLVLYQLAASAEGKAAMLDGNAVAHLVWMLKKGKGEFESESTRENCVAALYALSHGSMRFKALAKEARVMEVLKEVEEDGSERAKEKARRIMVVLKVGESIDWEAILESDGGGGGLSRARNRVGDGPGCGKTAEF
ncbi:U-box domain-containing protein 38-like [Chenopodium quinoa]|uniref:RING-type E3 ubiquitin transferase n=1 Tax=Chenopodium quinoa TaxID=63459 RepID=A0A803L8U2_CHEQI|nr:U-box domain-containing protein 38-like [Chenopodium quinoa]